ncbi:MAG: [ribosomal protein S18]-alanine N-acetyltransferase [Sphingomonadales bacterium]|nr:[ribosomal protein S18]-alanine N-acetyltransferase [Sphingomonadales bacterium]MEA3048425.1 [ribosomal protein S18]-alanine N-acetyltransferase [Sphingomonadales bacterium]
MSGEVVEIEEGGLLDLEPVMTVMRESFDPAFGEAWTAPQCAGLLPMPGVWLSLARRREDVVGFALGRVVGDEAELLLLAVRRQSQGRGIGRKLLHRFQDVASRKGAEHLHLEVRDGNYAVGLYTASGFREVGRRKNYYQGRDGQLYDALTLAKKALS